MIRKILIFSCLTIFLAGAGLFYSAGKPLQKIKDTLPRYLIEMSWQQAKKGDDQKPWPWLESTPVAKLSVPDIDRSFVVMQGVSGSVLSYAPGWHEGTDMPGKPGISLISGHRETHFDFLRFLEPGQMLSLETKEGVKQYYVDELVMVQDSEMKVPVDDKDSILLLSTSYPSTNWQIGKELKFVVVAREFVLPPSVLSGVPKNMKML